MIFPWSSTGFRVMFVGCLLCLTIGQSRADYIYKLRFDKAVYDVNPGSTQKVGLILSEEVSGNDKNRLGFFDAVNDMTYGLTTADMEVTWAAGGASVKI